MRIGKYIVVAILLDAIKRDNHKSRLNSIIYYVLYPIMPLAWLGMIVAPVACFSMFFTSVFILIGGRQDKISSLTHVLFIAVGIYATYFSFVCFRRLIYYLRQNIIAIEYVFYAIGIFLALLLWGMLSIILMIFNL